MAVKLQPYSEYKDSGVKWLGKVPSHWKCAAVKRHYSIRLGKMVTNAPSHPTDSPIAYLKARHVHWFLVEAKNLPTMWASRRDLEQFGVKEGDLLVCEGGEGGRSGIVREAPSPCIIQNALHRVRSDGRSTCEFLQFVMAAVNSTGWFAAINSKATIAHFTYEKFGSLSVPISPLEEQVSIVRYLTFQNRKINRFIRNKRRLIALLREQKQAIINQAVTRGIDPNVPLKPSGIYYWGNIPERWHVRRLKSLCSINSGQVDPRITPYKSKVLIAPNHVESGTGRLISMETADAQGADSGKYQVEQGQVIYSKIRPLLRKATIAPCECLCSADMYAISFHPELLLSQYALLLLLSEPFNNYAEDCSMRVAMPKINRDALGLTWLILPSVEEQRSILEYVKDETQLIDTAISRAEREIELMNEYRTRLIADVVTGKVDVRGIDLGEASQLDAMDEEALCDEDSDKHLLESMDDDSLQEDADNGAT